MPPLLSASLGFLILLLNSALTQPLSNLIHRILSVKRRGREGKVRDKEWKEKERQSKKNERGKEKRSERQIREY